MDVARELAGAAGRARCAVGVAGNRVLMGMDFATTKQRWLSHVLSVTVAVFIFPLFSFFL